MTAMTQPAPAGFPVTTAFALPGMTVEQDLGVAFGLVVRSMGAVKSIGAGFKALRQGEVTQYTELLEDSRRHAIDRLIENARLLGANAVVAMRFDSSEMASSSRRSWPTARRSSLARLAVVAMPETPPPPGPRSLVSDADRERLLVLLGEHYARGQLELDEMSRLVGGWRTAWAAVSVSCVTASGWGTIAT
jgi:uncharacterized protein YbjQ (UPF0145 family)